MLTCVTTLAVPNVQLSAKHWRNLMNFHATCGFDFDGDECTWGMVERGTIMINLVRGVAVPLRFRGIDAADLIIEATDSALVLLYDRHIGLVAEHCALGLRVHDVNGYRIEYHCPAPAASDEQNEWRQPTMMTYRQVALLATPNLSATEQYWTQVLGFRRMESAVAPLRLERNGAAVAFFEGHSMPLSKRYANGCDVTFSEESLDDFLALRLSLSQHISEDKEYSGVRKFVVEDPNGYRLSFYTA